LIEFSNDKFYENKLLFGTKNNNSIEPLEIVDIIKNVRVVNGVNKEEANQILTRLKTEVEKNIFKKILVICFTKTQKEFIANKIATDAKFSSILNKVKRGLVVIGDISSVQGDEGNLSMISVVFTKTDPNFGLLTNPRGSNYLNVAITRAKSKMIIFKSIKNDDIIGDPLNKDLTIFAD
jgi:superfamily I DNA and/or RNA helicase